MNSVQLLGNLGSDPEMKFTPSGKGVCNFSLATNETWKDTNGEKQQRTTWHRIVVWGNQATACATNLSKGRQVMVTGKIQTRSYEDKDGIKRYVTDIVAQRVQFLGANPNKVNTRETNTGANDQDFAGDDIPY